jgi:superfamily II DNA helicase RecQ
MSGKRQRVHFHLDSGKITHLEDSEIKAILRAADELIATGGRSMLSKILKGSRDKKVMEHGLDQCPVYGFYSNLTIPEITQRIDWAIVNDYLKIEYSDRLPVIVFSSKGWEIEIETYAEELLQKLTNLLSSNDYSFVGELKDRNRGMILLLIEKIRKTNNPDFIPLLKAWQEIDYKKVRLAIQEVIDYLKFSLPPRSVED